MFLLACFFGRVAGAGSLLHTSFFFLGNELKQSFVARFVALYVLHCPEFLNQLGVGLN